MAMLALLLAFAASTVGGICGIGGGVIIKPVLDLIGFASVSAISFMSSCTVLSMSLYSVCRGLCRGSRALERGKSDYLAISAAVGGVAGNLAFQALRNAVGNERFLGGAQSLTLLLLVLGTLLYTLYKERITPRSTDSKGVCALIGLFLGGISSFLGIGGGPFNLVVLHYFLGYETKRAVENSLYIILLSQLANLLLSLLSGTIPDFRPAALLLMVLGGIGGGVAGRAICSRLEGRAVDKLFLGLLGLIALISVYNAYSYLLG